MTSIDTIRQKMVDGQVRPSDVTDLRIIDAMNNLAREVFVAERQKQMAYLDIEAALDATDAGAAGSGRRMLKPAIVARLLQAATIAASDDVMVVGCGTGYTSAIAAHLAARVLGVESDTGLARRAAANAKSSGGAPISIATGPLTAGDPTGARHNVIIVDGAVQTGLNRLAQQLADGGRLVGLLATGAVSQAVLVTRVGDDFGRRTLFDASGPVLPGFERPQAFTF